jgi:hypothetical protein
MEPKSPEFIESEVSTEEKLSNIGSAIEKWADNLDAINQGAENNGNTRGKVLEAFSSVDPSLLTTEQQKFYEILSNKDPSGRINLNTDDAREQAKLFFPQDINEEKTN